MNKIFTFVIGLLVGAIITTAGFMIYLKTTDNKATVNEGMPQMMGGNMEMGTPPDMNGNSMGTPPEKPDGDNNSNRQTPHKKPTDDTNVPLNENSIINE